MDAIRIGLAQLNPTVGDLEGNLSKITGAVAEAEAAGAHLIAFPELMITGYPPEDLLLKSSFVRDNLDTLSFAASSIGIAAIIGFVDRDSSGIYNAAAIVAGGEVRGIYRKHHLPNYGVFDEERYFEPGDGILLARMNGCLIGVTVCEDLWIEDGPHLSCAAAGATIVVNINGSPYHRGKGKDRIGLLASRAKSTGAMFAYVNMVGGQDELVFDGQSMVVGPQGDLIARGSQFEEEILYFDYQAPDTSPLPAGIDSAGAAEALRIVDIGTRPRELAALPIRIAGEMEPAEEVYTAIVLGVRDYLHKNGFHQAVIGLSGGIDSSLTAAVAADAIGAENVLGVLNPSRFTAEESNEYAEKLGRNLGIEFITLPIDSIFEDFLTTLQSVFHGTEWNVAEENIQSRIRGVIWMAISNKSELLDRRRIVLSAGNKSEMAVGYATLYGDMAGGFAVLKDVPKTLVYELARWRNRDGEVIPQAVIDRPPTAELKPDQLDTDSLPPYEVLDPILEAYVEDDLSPEEIVALGFNSQIVARVIVMVDRAEYKRRQAPPGIKITERAFGRDRRLPITNRYRPAPRRQG